MLVHYMGTLILLHYKGTRISGPYPLLPPPRPEKTFSLVPVLTERNCQGFVFSATYRNQMEFIADGPSGDRSNRRRFEIGGSTAALKAAAAAVGPPPFCNTAGGSLPAGGLSPGPE